MMLHDSTPFGTKSYRMRVQGHDGSASRVHTPKLDSLARRLRRGYKEPSRSNGVLTDGLLSRFGSSTGVSEARGGFLSGPQA